MRQNQILFRIYYLITIFLICLLFQHINSLRCKCNTNRGPAPCSAGFCDIHNRGGKRAACGALRRSRQTIFACVLIRRSSNDTYCHVVDSTTACWCRQIDFCNADLEAELFDVEESGNDSFEKTDSVEESNQNINSEREAVMQHVSDKALTTKESSQILLPKIFTTVTQKPYLSTSTKRSIRTKINPAVPLDFVTQVKVTPQQKEQSPAVTVETILDEYEDVLDDNDDGYQWQAVTIPDISFSTINTAPNQTTTQTTQKNVSGFVELLITDIPNRIPTTTTPSTTISSTTSHTLPPIIEATTTINKFHIYNKSMKESVFGHLLNSNQERSSTSFTNEQSRSATIVVRPFQPELIQKHSLEPEIPSSSSTTMISSNNPITATTQKKPTEFHPAIVKGIFQHQRQIVDAKQNVDGSKSNSTTPTFVYNHLAPKTALDQWDLEEHQKNPTSLDWTNHGRNNNDRNSSGDRLRSALKLSFPNSLLFVVTFWYHLSSAFLFKYT